MMKKAMLCLLMILSVFLLAACQKQPQPEIKLPEPQAAGQPGTAGSGDCGTDSDPRPHRL